MAKKVPIKPGCLCIIKAGSPPIKGVVGPGDFVTAVKYFGDYITPSGTLMCDVWQITNERIEADLRSSPELWIGSSGKYLQPISDPDQEPLIALEDYHDSEMQRLKIASLIK